MSFQDFGKNKRVGATTAGVRPVSSSTYSSGGIGAGVGGGRGDGSLSQISESLTQYQRNVGLLEKLVQQVVQIHNSSTSMSSPLMLKELQMQYQVQIDVVQQLEQKVQAQMQNQQQQTSMGGNHQIIKLSRDFQTVQARVQALQKQAEQMKSMFGAADEVDHSNSSQMDSHNYEMEQQRIQLQLQEDRLAEEIMREREEEIRNINRGMFQVNEIYKDLAHIVGSQQEQIDTIQTQMEESRANAESGLKQVEKANEKYGSSNCTIS